MATKPPIALYFYRLQLASGGAERMICTLANSLDARGYSVHLISWDDAGAQTFFPLNADVHWHRLGFRAGWSDKIRRTRAVADLLRGERICVLAGFVMSGDKTIYLAAKLARTRLIAAERNAPAMYYLRYGFAQRLISFTMLHLADRITVQIGDFVRGYPRSLRGRIVVIPNPVAAAAHRAEPGRPAANGRHTLLAVGRLDSVQKRLDCLVRAFARAASDHPSWDLTIIGDGPEEASLRQLISGLGLVERIRLEASSPDIFAAYAAAHLFAIPSRWEGFSNALAEAMSHGLPAIGFREAAGVDQLIADGETGWLADGLDDDVSLARVLNEAMGDDAERVRRGDRAIAAMAAYAPEVQTDRWSRLLDSLWEVAR